MITISKIRSALYRSAKLLGDVNAIKRRKITDRIANRIVGRLSSKINREISAKIKKTRK